MYTHVFVVCMVVCMYRYYGYTVIVAATVISPLKIQLSSEGYATTESSGVVCIKLIAYRPASETFSVSLMPIGMLHNHSA